MTKYHGANLALEQSRSPHVDQEAKIERQGPKIPFKVTSPMTSVLRLGPSPKDPTTDKYHHQLGTKPLTSPWGNIVDPNCNTGLGVDQDSSWWRAVGGGRGHLTLAPSSLYSDTSSHGG